MAFNLNLMRITGGLARGITLQVPVGDSVRPATDALRQAVFSSLGARTVDSRCFDLFAGSGAYGLEALSRGALSCTFVEKSPPTAGCLRTNVAAVKKSIAQAGDGRELPTAVLEMDVAAAPFPVPAADLVFVDPPYEIIPDVADVLFARVAAEAAADVIVVFELPGQLKLTPPGWEMFKRLGKGGRQPTAGFFRRL
jgi:16S rRNA (guanine966-N2)-methyltransferase